MGFGQITAMEIHLKNMERIISYSSFFEGVRSFDFVDPRLDEPEEAISEKSLFVGRLLLVDVKILTAFENLLCAGVRAR